MIERILHKKIPEYYPTMYLDGFTPEEIRYALHKTMMKQIQESKNEKNTQKEIEKTVQQALNKLLKDFN